MEKYTAYLLKSWFFRAVLLLYMLATDLYWKKLEIWSHFLIIQGPSQEPLHHYYPYLQLFKSFFMLNPNIAMKI